MPSEFASEKGDVASGFWRSASWKDVSREDSSLIATCFVGGVVGGAAIKVSPGESRTVLLEKATKVSVGCCVVIFSSCGLTACIFFDSRLSFSAIDVPSVEDFDSVVSFFVHAEEFFCFFTGVVCAKMSLDFVTLLLAVLFATGDDVGTVGLT